MSISFVIPVEIGAADSVTMADMVLLDTNSLFVPSSFPATASEIIEGSSVSVDRFCFSDSTIDVISGVICEVTLDSSVALKRVFSFRAIVFECGMLALNSKPLFTLNIPELFGQTPRAFAST